MTRSEKPAGQLGKGVRCLLIGGGLGAGKTRAIARLAAMAGKEGSRARLLNRDHGTGHVDPVWLRSLGFEAAEVPGVGTLGKPDPLMEAMGRLVGEGQVDLLLAEEAGSRANLKPTVVEPLRRQSDPAHRVGPLSVVVDPGRASRIFKLESGDLVSPGLVQLFRRQLAEADLVVLSKVDLLSSQRRAELRRALETECPGAEVLEVSALTGEGFATWLGRLTCETRWVARPTHGEAADSDTPLAWLNCSARLSSKKYFEADALLRRLSGRLRDNLRREGVEVERLKIALAPDDNLGEIPVAHWVRHQKEPESPATLPEPIDSGRLILNLRAEGEPDILNEAVNDALLALVESFPHLFTRLEHLEHFRAGK